MPSTAIAIDRWGRRISVPIGENLPSDIDLNDEVEITIKGKVKTLTAAEPKDYNYKGDKGRPAELTIELTSVTLEGKTNTFTNMARNMDKLEYD